MSGNDYTVHVDRDIFVRAMCVGTEAVCDDGRVFQFFRECI